MRRVAIALFTIGTLMWGYNAQAQQDAHYSMYMFNGMAINPAYAGSEGEPIITAIYRHQWAGLDGAPRTIALSGHTPMLNESVAVGLTVIRDNISIFNNYSVTGSYAYRLPVGAEGKLAFGLGATINSYQAAWGNLVGGDVGDAKISALPNTVTNPNIGGGVYYNTPHFFAGFSVPHFLNASLSDNLKYEGSNEVARQYMHYFLTSGVILDLSKNVKFRPSVLMKYVKNAPLQGDINGSFQFMDALWLGVSYRTGDAVLGILEYEFDFGLRFGYAYDFTLSELNDYSSGSHEIMLGYGFGKDEIKMKTPRYF